MRLLFLLPHVPSLHAAHGGGRSTAQLIRALARRHEVAVLCLRRTDDEATDGDLRRLCSSYEEIRHSSLPRTPLGRLRHRILPLVQTPGWVLGTENSALRQRLRSLVAAWRPDIIHIAYHVMGQYADDVVAPGVQLVLTQHEPGVSTANDALRRARGIRRVSAALKHAVWAKYERRIMSRMDAIVVFTEEDRTITSRLAGHTRVTRIPLGIAIPEKPLNAVGRDSSILFVGNFSHPPNVHAALRLLRSIFPDVRRQCPNARLTIVGPNPTPEMTSCATANVTITGTVPSVEPFLDDANVVVAPLWEGGGMRVKVLEALAGGKAVVASPLATNGLAVTSGRQLIIASSDTEFATAIVKLLRDPKERTALARRAREWASSHLGWDQVAAEYETLHDWLRRSDQSKQFMAPGESALIANIGGRRLTTSQRDDSRNASKAELSPSSKAACDREPLPEAPVIVLNWNSWNHTVGCLRSLRAATDVSTVWLVDNASTDKRFEEAARIWPGLRVLRLDQNYGFAGGMNRALRVAASEGYQYAYLLNNDCVVEPGFLSTVLKVARAEDVAIVGSRVAYADGSNSVNFDGEYHPPGSKQIEASSETRRVPHADGAGMLVNLDALQLHGFFDERFFCYHEEVDLCWRLAASGFQAVIAAGSLIRHHRAGSDVDGNSAYYRTRNQFLLAEHFRGWHKFKRQLLGLYEAGVAGRRAIRGHDTVTWQALAAAIDDAFHKRFGRRGSYEVSDGANLQFRVLCAVLPLVGRVLRPRLIQERRARARTPRMPLKTEAPALPMLPTLTVAEPPIKDSAK